MKISEVSAARIRIDRVESGGISKSMKASLRLHFGRREQRLFQDTLPTNRKLGSVGGEGVVFGGNGALVVSIIWGTVLRNPSGNGIFS